MLKIGFCWDTLYYLQKETKLPNMIFHQQQLSSFQTKKCPVSAGQQLMGLNVTHPGDHSLMNLYTLTFQIGDNLLIGKLTILR